MVLTHRQILDIVILAYYAIAFILSLWLVVKHGFARQIGCFYLALLAILRLIGAGTGYASINHPASQELLETSVICTSIGISPLLLALLGILSRINNGMNGYRLSYNWSRIIHIPVIVGLILALVAGTKQFSSNSSTRNTSEHLLEGAVILKCYLLGRDCSGGRLTSHGPYFLTVASLAFTGLIGFGCSTKSNWPSLFERTTSSGPLAPFFPPPSRFMGNPTSKS